MFHTRYSFSCHRSFSTFSKKSSEEAETFMLVTEIIKIKEPDKLKDVKEMDNHKTQKAI